MMVAAGEGDDVDGSGGNGGNADYISICVDLFVIVAAGGGGGGTTALFDVSRVVVVA